MAGIRCGTCDAEWSSAARFCGRCGQPLRTSGGSTGSGASQGKRAGRGGGGRRSRWLGPAALVLGGIVVVAVLVTVGGSALDASGSDAGTAGTDVELPDPNEVDPGAAPPPDAPPDAPPAAPPGPEPLTCEPPGCELWRHDLGPGGMAEAEGILYHADASAVSAISPTDGRFLWRAAGPGSEQDGTESGPGEFEPVQIFRVDDVSPKLILGASGSVEARSVDDGQLLWRTALPGQIFHAVVTEDGLLLWGGPDQAVVETGEEGRVRDYVANLDPATGEPRWYRDEVELTGIDPDALIVSLGSSEVAGLDPATGEARWQRTVHPPNQGYQRIATGNGWAVVEGDEGLELLDAASGDVARQLSDLDLGPDGWMQVSGSLLILDQPSGLEGDLRGGSEVPGRQLTILDLANADARPQVFSDVFGRVVLTEDRAWPHAAPAGGQVLGVIVGTHGQAGVSLHRIDAAGEPAWRRDLPSQHDGRQTAEQDTQVLGEGWGWGLHAGDGPESFVLTPPDRSEPVRILASDDGRTVEEFTFPAEWGMNQPIRSIGTNAVLLADSGDGVVIAGREGSVQLSDFAFPILTEPALVLQAPTGLLAIDLRMLFGEQAGAG